MARKFPGFVFSADNPATPPEAFKTPVIPANYQFQFADIAPNLFLAEDGHLHAIIGGMLINYGNETSRKLELELKGGKLKKQTLALQTAPLQRRFEFKVPFEKIAKTVLENKEIELILKADSDQKPTTVKVDAQTLLARLFRPIRLSGKKTETSYKAYLSGILKTPRMLSHMPMALLHSNDDAKLTLNGTELNPAASDELPTEFLDLLHNHIYTAPVAERGVRFELSGEKEKLGDDELALFIQTTDRDYLKLSYNIEHTGLLTQYGFNVSKLPFADLLSAFVSGKENEVHASMQAMMKQISADSKTIKNNMIHMVGNAHIDLAWLWPWTETVDVCEQTFENALDLMEANPDFTYAQSQAQTYEWIEKYHPDLFERIKKMVKAGKWIIVNGMWTEPDSNIPSGEAFVRQILYGQRYFRNKFNVTSDVAWTPDTFGYAWTLPQIYKKAGFDYFVTTKIWWNDVTRPKHHLFWWESPDGSKILTFLPEGYGSNPTSENVLERLKRYQENTQQENLMVLYGKGDHGGGPSKQMLNQIDIMANVDYYPKVEYSTPGQFFKAVEATQSELPVVNDEMYLEYHRGCYTTQAKVKKYNRQLECLLETAEKFSSFAGIPYPKKELDDAWKRTLFNQFHDILPGSSIPIVYEQAHASYDTALTETNLVLNRALESIAAQVNTRGYGTPVVVFNPLSWTRNDLAIVDLPKEFHKKQLRVTDDQGWIVKSQSISGNRLLFEVNEIPSVGYKVFFVQVGKTRKPKDLPIASAGKLENSSFTLLFDEKTGNITSIYDRKQKREILSGAGNELQFFEDIPDRYDAWNIGYTGKQWGNDPAPKMEIIESGGVRATFRITKQTGKSTFTQDVSLYRNYPVIEFRNQVNWHESHVLAKAAFNLDITSETATYEIPYGTIQRPTVPKTAADSAKFEVSAHKWIDLTDKKGDYGVSLLNDSKYGFDVKKNLMRITLLRSPKSPDPEADMGEHEFTYSLYPHAGDWQSAETYERAYELNYPLQAVWPKKHVGSRPGSQSFAQLEGDSGIALTTLKKAEDSDELILRFVEIHGKASKATCVLQDPVAKARVVNLLEEPLPEEVDYAGQRININLKPYEIKSIAVQIRK